MSPTPSGTGGNEPNDALRRIEERVRRVQDLGPFEIDRRGDGRFRCQLEEPLSELSPSELRHGMEILESLQQTLQDQLDEAATS